MGPLTNITHHILHIIQLVLSTKIPITLLPNQATKLYYRHKKAQNHLTCEQNPKSPTKLSYKAHCYTAPQSSLLHDTSKARCYITSLKACYYTAFLKSSLLHGTSKSPLIHGTSKTRCYTAPLKARCYTALLKSSLLHGTSKARYYTAPFKARCYMTPFKARCYTALLKSPLLQHFLKARCYTAPLKPVTTRHF